jgi:predicted  nucleic acid-binding Zn-ribbon protein
VLEGLRRLLELQRLDDERAAFQEERSGFPERRRHLEETRARCEAAVTAAREALHAAETDQRRSESELQDHESQLQKFESQQFQVKSNDAYTALLTEMDRAREAISRCETQILEAMEGIETATVALAASEEEDRTTRGEVAAESEAIDAREKVVEAEIARLDGERDRLCREIDAALLSRYSRIAALRRPAVVLISKEMCVGCRVDIPPQNYIEILRGESIITCGNCQRVLVHEQAIATPASPEPISQPKASVKR